MDDEVEDVELPLYEGYFTVTIPPNLLKLLGGNVLKLRKAVTEYDIFLKQYGAAASVTEPGFHDEGDNFSWVYFTGMSFIYPQQELVVKVETRSEALFVGLQQGIVSERWQLFLRGTAIVSKENDVDNIDKNLLDISIKKVETYWDGVIHSSSPDREVIRLEEEEREKEKVKRGKKLEKWFTQTYHDDDPFFTNEPPVDDIVEDDDVPF